MSAREGPATSVPVVGVVPNDSKSSAQSKGAVANDRKPPAQGVVAVADDSIPFDEARRRCRDVSIPSKHAHRSSRGDSISLAKLVELSRTTRCHPESSAAVGRLTRSRAKRSSVGAWRFAYPPIRTLTRERGFETYRYGRRGCRGGCEDVRWRCRGCRGGFDDVRTARSYRRRGSGDAPPHSRRAVTPRRS